MKNIFKLKNNYSFLSMWKLTSCGLQVKPLVGGWGGDVPNM